MRVLQIVTCQNGRWGAVSQACVGFRNNSGSQNEEINMGVG